MTFIRRLSRRQLVRSTAAGAALAPFVPLLDPEREGRAHAAEATPKRILFFYSSNGTVREKWLPTVANGELVLPDILKPLEAYKKRMLVVDGLGINVPGWTGHHLAVPLTGSRRRMLDDKENWLSESISVDQLIANKIGATTKFRSIEAGIQVDDWATWVSCLSYRGPGQALKPENSPYKLFDRVFTGLTPPRGGGANTALEQASLDRKGVIAFVSADLARLRTRLGSDEQKKLDAHLEGLSDIERTLTAGKGAAAIDSCKVPDKGQMLDPMKNDDIPAIGRLHTDLMLMAMACDLTRVGTIQHGRGGAQHRFSWLGAEFQQDPAFVKGVDETTGIHSLAHAEGKPGARALLARCHTWYAGEVAYVLDRLGKIPEGNGTMADNTVVVWMNEQGTGNHSLKNMPWVIIGGGWHFKQNALAQFPGVAHNKLLLNLAHCFGLQDNVFGEPDHGTGPLAGIAV